MSDILSSATLLLTIIGLLYTVWYPTMTEALATKVPQYPEDRIRPLPRVRDALKTKALPLAAASILLTLVFMPVAWSIAVRSMREFFAFGLAAGQHYDPVQAAFFLVVLASAVFAFHTIALSCKLAALLKKLEAKK